MKSNNMFKNIVFTCLILSVAAVSCKKESGINSEKNTQNAPQSAYLPATQARLDSIRSINEKIKQLTGQAITASPDGITGEFSDASGLIKIQVFESTFGPAQHNVGTVTVGADYVLVGGGAYTEQVENGAYITESRPDFGLRTWYARSKDHADPDAHTLKVYAVGMRIEGVSADVLRSYMQVFSTTSGAANHPNTSVTVPGNYLLIGGGATVNWSGFGNLLTGSYPSGNTWYASSKDHIFADVTTITAYAIGIQNTALPVVGNISIENSYGTGYASTGRAAASASIPAGWVTTCPGSRTTWGSYGRMLMDIKMDAANPFNVSTQSKDHRQPDAGYIYPYAVRIKKQ